MDKSDLAKVPPVAPRRPRLRILLVVNLQWDSRLGAVRVFMELAEQWRAAGHTVEKYSASEAFGPGASPARSALRQITFGYKAASFVRRNATRFDVVDALIGSLHGSKERLRFRGLIVARSVGLYRLYERFDQEAQRRWPAVQGKLLTRLFYNRIHRWFRKLSDASVREADLLNVPNAEEKECLQKEGIKEAAITMQPYGLSAERRDGLVRSAAPAQKRLSGQTISFVGMWAPRKGSRDWREIVRLIWLRVPDARFKFLGTMVEPETVLDDLGIKFSARIEIVPEYSQTELAELLCDCAVGAFPSYVEGFGIAVLEQLAAGIPTVAFDVAGPRDMLRFASSELLVPPGNIPKFADAVIRILQSELKSYRELSAKCSKAAGRFDWTEIARATAATYQERLSGGSIIAAHHGS